jgi:hypothetical protein
VHCGLAFTRNTSTTGWPDPFGYCHGPDGPSGMPRITAICKPAPGGSAEGWMTMASGVL